MLVICCTERFEINMFKPKLERCFMFNLSSVGFLVSGKTSFKGFTVYGHGGHLGYQFSICFENLKDFSCSI